MHDLFKDIRYGARTLRRSPGLTAVALVTLTLAIGANTAIFSLIDPLLFRDLPVRDPARLVEFVWRYPGDPPMNLFGVQHYELYRDRNTVFSDMAGLAPIRAQSPNGDDPLRGEVVTGNLFQMLGVRPAMGRLLEPSDDKRGAAPVAVVSWRFWKNRFSGNAQVLGTPIDIDDPRVPQPIHATVVGVSESGFSGLTAGYQPDVWMSLTAIPEADWARGGLALIARLKPGASIAQARAEMRLLDQARITELAVRDPQWRQVLVDVKPARAGLSTPLHDQFGGPLFVLMLTVGVLLLLACANIGGLLLARGAARQHEMALRVSLGAGRFRIMRQVMTESLLLAAAGGALGFAGARVGATVLVRLVTSGTRSLAGPPQFAIPLDARVLLFTAGVTTIAALLFGLAPALPAFVSTPIALLRGRAGSTQPRSRRLFGSGLVTAQVALSLALVSVSQLCVAHLSQLRDRSLGFDRDDVLVVSVDPPGTGLSRERLITLYSEAASRLRAIPGVRSVAVSGMTPISGAAGSRFVRVEGYDEPAQNRRRRSLNVVSPNYFATLGTPLLAGRDFRDADGAHPGVAIINQAMARQYFAGRDPIGRRLWFDTEREPYEIVGLAGDAKYQDVRIAAPPTVYVYAPVFRGSASLSIRTAVAPTAVAGDARRVLADVFGGGAVKRVTTLAEQVDVSIVPERLMAMLSGFFGLVGALLAAIGLYGLLAYTVARRTNEIGIRMALGATRGNVIAMVLKSAIALVLAGVIVGLPAAYWGQRLVASMVEHLPAGGLAPMLVGAATLFGVALLAAYVPVRRATRVDPAVALRSE
jgi:putative ABC transport system permease protein